MLQLLKTDSSEEFGLRTFVMTYDVEAHDNHPLNFWEMDQWVDLCAVEQLESAYRYKNFLCEFL